MIEWIGQGVAALVSIIALSVQTPSQAASPSVPGACPKAGTVLQLSNGAEITAKSQDGLWCTFGVKGGRDARIFGSLVTEFNGFGKDEEEGIAKLWPLEVGKTAKYIQREGRNSWSEEWRVDRKETVKTQAGTFDTFVVIDHEETLATGNVFRGNYIYYLSPEIGYIAKFDFKMESGSPSGAPSSWELTKIIQPN